MYSQNYPTNRQALILRNKTHISAFLKKPIVLVLAISTMLTTVISAVLSSSYSGLFMATYGKDIIDFVEKYANSGDAPSFSADFSTYIAAPSAALVTFIALLLMFIGAKKIDKPVSKAGLLIYRILGIITLVVSIILLVSLVLCSFFLIFMIVILSTQDMADISSSIEYFDAPALMVFFAVVSVFCIFSGVFTLLSGIGFAKFSGSLYKSYTTDKLSAKGSKLYAAVNIISATAQIMLCFVLIISVALLNSYFGYASRNVSLAILGIAHALVSAITPIMTAVFALGYNKHIKSAGRNGEYLPMPVIEQAPTAYNVPVAPVAPVTPTTSPAPVAEPAVANVTSANENNPYAAHETTSVAVNAPAEEANPYAAPEATEPAPAPQPKAVAPVANFCHNCGNRITPDQNFCNQCGTRLN